MRNYLRIGEIITLHGIKGEVKVYPTTDDIKRFDNLKEFYIVDSKDADDSTFDGLNLYEKENVKYLKNTVILKIKGFDSIDESKKLIKKNIYVNRTNAIKLSENEYFIVDLIGLDAYHEDQKLGKVIDVLKTKANDILVISYSKKELLVPLVDEYIDTIDLMDGFAKIKKIEGLI